MPQSRQVSKGKQFTFERERETKGAVRFKEDTGDSDVYAIGSLYIRKEFDKELGSPDTLKVQVTAS